MQIPPDPDDAYAAAILRVQSGSPADWTAALTALRSAAEDPRADADLAALSSLGGDGAALLAVPQMRVLSPSPRIAVIHDFATREICERLIACARPRLQPAHVYDHDTGGPRQVSIRDNSEMHLTRNDGLVPLLVRQRIARATEIPEAAMEATTILHYTPGQRFEPHYDFLDPAQPGPAREIAEAGQRVLTFLLSLNDGYEGGETEFPMLGKRYKGNVGTALFFWNVEPNGVPDRRTLHAGLPTVNGEKWLLSQWVRERTWRAATFPIR